MLLKETYQVEKNKWDAVAQKEMADLETQALSPDDDFYAFCRKSATHIEVLEFLGDLEDKHVLEYGCGLGQMSSLLAKNCAKVTTFDLSAGSVAVAKKRAEINGVSDKIRLAAAAGENLPFASESFDVIFGKAILHHLHVHLGWYDLFRVLKPGGRAVFIEPMGINPVLNFVRDRIPYPGKNDRGADRPLNYEEIECWGRGFRAFHYREIQLLSMLERGFGQHVKFRFLRRMDDFLLSRFPFLRRYCRYVVMYMVK